MRYPISHVAAFKQWRLGALSEVLNFLTDDESKGLIMGIVHDCTPGCDILCR